jgi:YebC/PmpR family DNA-binding regulatory protein
MAGHSKWANIKHRKGAQDAKRGKIFTKIIKELTVAARIGGGDPDCNPRLRTAVDKAKQANMPKDNVDRAIKKGTGDLDGVNYEEGIFEGYGPAGVAIIVEFLTDNRTRTVADVRHIFSKHGGNLGVSGSVSFLFDRKGLISFSTDNDFDQIFEAALEAGAEDVKDEGDAYEVVTDPSSFMEVRDAMEAAGLEWETAETTMIPQNQVQLEAKPAETMLKLMDALEDNDDVQNVFANFDISDEELAKIMD